MENLGSGAVKRVLLIEADKASHILLTAIVHSVDQDIQVRRVESLRAAREALYDEKEAFQLVILGLGLAGSRARQGFLEQLQRRCPELQLLLLRSAKPPRRKLVAERKSVPLLKYISLHLDLDQCRHLIERLLNKPVR